MKYLTPMALICLLAGCAVTPEQRARLAAEQKQYEQNLKVSLAAQCDKDTALIMQRQFNGDTGATEKERKAFRLDYLDRVNDKMFQSCYRMAWQNHINLRRLENAERWHDLHDYWGFWGPYPFRRW